MLTFMSTYVPHHTPDYLDIVCTIRFGGVWYCTSTLWHSIYSNPINVDCLTPGQTVYILLLNYSICQKVDQPSVSVIWVVGQRLATVSVSSGKLIPVFPFVK